jgi:hypothetical protein
MQQGFSFLRFRSLNNVQKSTLLQNKQNLWRERQNLTSVQKMPVRPDLEQCNESKQALSGRNGYFLHWSRIVDLPAGG